MIDIWQRHAERERRRLQLARCNQWLLDHPGQARLVSIAAGLVLFGLAQLIQFGIDRLAKMCAP